MEPSKSLSPIEAVQNPALGSTLLWKFGSAYQDESSGDLPNLLLFFLVLPLAFHAATAAEITSTKTGSGLSKLVEKLGEEREKLIAVHARASAMRALTLESLSTALAARILRIEHGTALVRANEVTLPKLPERLKPLLPAADRLGRWFSRLPDSQCFSLLQVYP